MRKRIENIIEPYVNQYHKAKAYDDKINVIQPRFEELKELDPLCITLKQFEERNQLQNYLDFLITNKSNLMSKNISFLIETNSPFHRIGYLFGLEMEKDTELQEAAKTLKNAVLRHNKSDVSLELTHYNEVFEKVFEKLLQSIKDLLEELTKSYTYGGRVSKKTIENQYKLYLPKILDPSYIIEADKYQREVRESVYYDSSMIETVIVNKPRKPRYI